MPKVLVALLLLISLSVGAAEPQGFVQSQNPLGFVLKGAFVNSDGLIKTMYFPGEGKVAVFKTEAMCNKVKNQIDADFKKSAPEMQYLQMCIPTPEGLVKKELKDYI
jgi:hypothetical protein